jgi:predicted Zn-ribbon and HTH transcriptional regulator
MHLPCRREAEHHEPGPATKFGFQILVSCGSDKGGKAPYCQAKNLCCSSRQRFGRFICSHEHENAVASTLVAHPDEKMSADGIEFMDSALKTLKAALEAVRDLAVNALNQIGQSEDECSMRWKCKECRYIKHFTRAVTLEAAGRCPRCKSTEFRPIL